MIDKTLDRWNKTFDSWSNLKIKFSILVFKIWLTLYYSIIYSDLILMEKDVKGAIFEICFWTYVGMIINVHAYYAKCLCIILWINQKKNAHKS